MVLLDLRYLEQEGSTESQSTTVLHLPSSPMFRAVSLSHGQKLVVYTIQSMFIKLKGTALR